MDETLNDLKWGQNGGEKDFYALVGKEWKHFRCIGWYENGEREIKNMATGMQKRMRIDNLIVKKFCK